MLSLPSDNTDNGEHPCLSVDIPSRTSIAAPVNLADCLRAFMIEKPDDKWSCSECGGITAQKNSRIVTSPRILMLHLKRFLLTETGYQKNEALVRLPEVLEVGDDQYWIVAKVNHIGCSMSSGHYTAEINAGKWKCIDDRRVVEMGRMKEFSKEAYLVFYEKKK